MINRDSVLAALEKSLAMIEFDLNGEVLWVKQLMLVNMEKALM